MKMEPPLNRENSLIHDLCNSSFEQLNDPSWFCDGFVIISGPSLEKVPDRGS